MTLADESCKQVAKGSPALSENEARAMLRELRGWTLNDNAIERELQFKDFKEAMGFVTKVARLADEEDHHPDIFISYNKVRLTLSTHKINGLSTNDFILAAKIDKLG